MTPQLNGRRLAILGFHKIGEPRPGGWASWFYISETVFACQLGYLHENGWHVIDIGGFLQRLSAPERWARPGGFLAVDDGYRSTLAVGPPCFPPFWYSSVIFFPTPVVGGHHNF